MTKSPATTDQILTLLEKQNSQFNKRFLSIERKLENAVTTDELVINLKSLVRQIETRFDSLDNRFDSLESVMNQHNYRAIEFDQRLDKIEPLVFAS